MKKNDKENRRTPGIISALKNEILFSTFGVVLSSFKGSIALVLKSRMCVFSSIKMPLS